MKALDVPSEILLALFLAGFLATAAIAEIGADPNRAPAAPTQPIPDTAPTPNNRTGLPPAPPEKMAPGVGSRGLTGNDATPSPRPGPTKPGNAEPVR
jgi:hypothetical protein